MQHSLEYQLGSYVADRIYRTSLPTLSTDAIKSNKVIYVTAAEGDKYRSLEKIWFKDSLDDKLMIDGQSWKELTNYRNQLAAKYLPHTLECYVPTIYRTIDFNESDFKEGIRDYLWNTDLCWYNITTNDDVIIDWEEVKGYFTKISFTLAIE